MGMKIAFFTTGMTAGGAERVIATLANELSARGNEVVVAMVKGDRSEYSLAEEVGLRSAHLQPGFRNLPAAIKFYRTLVRQETPDIVASFSVKSDIIALLSRTLFRARGRLVVSDRNDPYTRKKMTQMICNYLYASADLLVCQSEGVARYYRKKCKKLPIVVIPNPLNKESIGRPEGSNREPYILAVGRLYPQKNQRLAIKAFAEIHRRFPDLSLKIFGAGPLKAELQKEISVAGLSGHISLEGVVPNVIRENSRASLFLFTSDHEGYPNALMEAAASGIPSVTTDFSPGTAREIIEAGVNGYIVPSGDQNAVSKAMLKVLSGALDPEKVTAASHRIRGRHQLDRIVDLWLSTFRSL